MDPKVKLIEVAECRELPEEVVDSARRLLERYEYRGGKAPSSIAAGALYLAWQVSSNSTPTQEEVANWFERSEVTLRNAKQELLEEIDKRTLVKSLTISPKTDSNEPLS